MIRCGRALAMLIGVLLSVLGCTVEEAPAAGEIGVARSALEVDNALNANALNANALYPNALNANALNANALDPSALSASALSAITDPGPSGDLSRQLLRYTVSCALNSSESFAFSWTDSLGVVHDEDYPGLLGLAPRWASRPIGVSDQQWISACLASRVNWFGVSVIISSRGSEKVLRKPGTAEITTYAFQEGAFWGNLFTDSPEVSACHFSANDSHSRAAERVCATGNVDDAGAPEPCGIIQLAGDCSTICSGFNPKGLFWANCGSSTGHVVTTFLP